MDPQNLELAEQIRALKQSPYWPVLEKIRDLLISDLKNRLFSPARAEQGMSGMSSIPLMLEPNLNAILGNRAGKVEGIIEFFTLLERYFLLLNETDSKRV